MITEKNKQSQMQEMKSSTQSQTANCDISNKAVLPTYTAEDKKQITTTLLACLAVQRTYGKDVKDIKTVLQVFLSRLNKFEPQQIIDALLWWLDNEKDFPTVADIKQVIEPKPKIDFEFYKNLRKKRAECCFLSLKEEKYIKFYENEIMKGL